ncbi:MAG: GTPase domain-containing protein [Phycisphaerae bacterium]|jgi:hypothetical protein
MSNDFAWLFRETEDWFERAAAAGWLTDVELRRLRAVERGTPADLFANPQTRPLVVALFGGSGVGKSSMLNRLAGEPIARTGVQRPTSTEVTIYVHESVGLADLPPELPVQRVQVRRHRNDERRDVLWLDAPDIDTTREENRKLVFAWLPHIDLLIYVVSPERYRDDVGWRVLLERGHKHAWIFALNRWDEGDPAQRDDLGRMLRDAGFESPVTFCTCCREPARDPPISDQFHGIEAAIRELLVEHGVRELERLGHRARLMELRGALAAARPRFGEPDAWRNLAAAWARHEQLKSRELLTGAEWSIRNSARRLAAQESARAAPLLQRVVGLASAARPAEAAPALPAQETRLDVDAAAAEVWDDWTQGKLSECLDLFEIELSRAGVATMPVRSRLEEVVGTARETAQHACADRLRAALARPGGTLRRAARRVTGFLMAFLPLTGAGLVLYNLIGGFVRGAFGGGPTPDLGAAASGALLVALLWLIPFLLDRWLRPSIDAISQRALRLGLQSALQRLHGEFGTALQTAIDEADALRDENRELEAKISAAALRPISAGKAAIGRLLMTSSRRAPAAVYKGAGES